METSLVQQAKLAVVAAAGLSKDALHIYVGLAVFLVMAYVWRWRESVHDIWNTLFWPTVLWIMVLLRAIKVGGAINDSRADN
jgi:hypothetical protein